MSASPIRTSSALAARPASAFGPLDRIARAFTGFAASAVRKLSCARGRRGKAGRRRAGADAGFGIAAAMLVTIGLGLIVACVVIVARRERTSGLARRADHRRGTLLGGRRRIRRTPGATQQHSALQGDPASARQVMSADQMSLPRPRSRTIKRRRCRTARSVSEGGRTVGSPLFVAGCSRWVGCSRLSGGRTIVATDKRDTVPRLARGRSSCRLPISWCL